MERYFMSYATTSGILSVLLIVLLVPSYGATGAALALIASHGVSILLQTGTVSYFIFHKKHSLLSGDAVSTNL